MANQGEVNLGFDLLDGRSFAIKEKGNVLGIVMERGGTIGVSAVGRQAIDQKRGTNGGHAA